MAHTLFTICGASLVRSCAHTSDLSAGAAPPSLRAFASVSPLAYSREFLRVKDPPAPPRRDVAPHRQAHPRAVELDRRHEAAIQPTPGVARRTTRFAPNHARNVRRNRVGGRWPTAVRRSGRGPPYSGAAHSGRFSRWIGMNESPRAPDCIQIYASPAASTFPKNSGGMQGSEWSRVGEISSLPGNWTME